MSERPCPSPPVDLTRILAVLGDNMVVLEKLIGHLRTNSPLLLEELRTAIDQKRHNGVCQTAHALREALSNFGIERAARLAFLLEQKGKAQNLTAAPTLLKDLEGEVDRILDYFDGQWKRDWL